MFGFLFFWSLACPVLAIIFQISDHSYLLRPPWLRALWQVSLMYNCILWLKKIICESMSPLHLQKRQCVVPWIFFEFLFILEASSSMVRFCYGVGILIYQPDDYSVCIKNGDLNAFIPLKPAWPLCCCCWYYYCLLWCWCWWCCCTTTTFSAIIIVVCPSPCASLSLAACLMPASVWMCVILWTKLGSGECICRCKAYEGLAQMPPIEQFCHVKVVSLYGWCLYSRFFGNPVCWIVALNYNVSDI